MRSAFLLLLSSAVYGQSGSIEGVAINKVNGTPLAGVHVRLVSAGMDGLAAAYGAMSDRTGHFSIASIPAGAYLLLPEYTGFIYSPPKSDSPLPGLQIKAGQHITDYKLEMSPRSVLAGRVVDEYGDPLSNANVLMFPATPGEEKLNLFGPPRPQVDDRGEFRLVVAPGKYYLKAEPAGISSDLPEIRTDGTSDALYGPTFYPSASIKDRAVVIEAKPGGDVTGLEIRLIRQRNLTISGIVNGIPESPGVVQVTLRYGENAQQLYGNRNIQAGRDGRFTVGRLTPGFYRVTARFNSGNQQQLVSAPVDLKLESDENNVQLSLTSGAELTGTLEISGIPAAKRNIRLQSAQQFEYVATNQSPVDPDGAFRIASVAPGKYTIVVSPLPDEAYVKAVSVDGAAAPDGVIDLSGGARGSRIKVQVATGAGQISGKVIDKYGQTIANSLTFVFLMKDAKALSDQSMIRVDSDGSFQKKGIPPGTYRIFALDLFHYVGMDTALSQQPDFSKPFSRGEEIVIHEGDKIVKDLKVLDKEDGDAKR